ncbi:leucine-rich repeat-containing protein 49-like isoform X2 [Physella acuta]|uniref:leucine-rich repeat-containing protein 49-like isoform X2 n=1 Tax=Physella acuta TaxID=109671 RepID=UPI0027DAFBE5|nr:leucine-rich repeat-containing protein 49-like isoform X2 [Physella acuta]
MYSKTKPKILDGRDTEHSGAGGDVIFRTTNIGDSRVVKRFPHQQLGDFQLNTFAEVLHQVQFDFEKIPIHFRSNKKSFMPAFTQDFGQVVQHQMVEEDIGSVQNREVNSGSAHGQGHVTPKPSKVPLLPGDRVIFAESPSAPGVPVVYRTADERASNPDRLNLDRRKLAVCPVLEGEEQLRLLNYQHNFITRIEHLASLKRLIFLDLYDNHIEEISGLTSLKSLRVLMLGKNRIKKMENLESLLKLDVLDLHGNQISKIENINHLIELRVLNLAGNNITHVDELVGMDSLAELNLRRNRIRTVTEVDLLPNLQRLFLSFNEISSFEDVQCLGESTSLSEISLDGNPLCQDSNYKHIILRHMQQLKQLDMKRVSEEERRISLVMARKEEEKKREMNKIAVLKEKRRLAINNAKRQWETMQGSMMSRTSRLVKVNNSMPELFANHIGSIPNMELRSPLSGEIDGLEVESLTSDLRSRPGSARSNLTDTEKAVDENKEQPRSASRRRDNRLPPRDPVKDSVSLNHTVIGDGLNMLEQIEGDTLSLYGVQSLEAFDRNWGVQAAGTVNVIVFKFIDFDSIVKQLPKIRVRFPATQTLVFCSTNIHSLQQINALSLVRRLDNLTIDLDGNPVTKFTLWRMYTVFRLAHFALKKINDVEVSSGDIVNAEKLFGPLSHVATSQLPQYRLLSLMGDNRRKQAVIEGRKQAETGKGNPDKAQVELIGRAGLTYIISDSKQDLEAKRHFAHNYIKEMTKESTFIELKKTEILKLWPSLITEIVQNALNDMKDMDSYMKCSLEEVEKG